MSNSQNNVKMEITSNTSSDINITSNESGSIAVTPKQSSKLLIKQSGGGSGTSNYNLLTNKPKINGVELIGDMKSEDLGISATLYFNITYDELQYLQAKEQLAAGCTYRITDYVTTSAQANTRSAGHPFDILVTALDSKTLDEHAKALPHEEDTYFANSNLEGWQLWYTLDNDNTRFAWADIVNGKGVIYRMIDEFNNDIPYDFKNIQMQNANNTDDTTYYYTFDNGNSDLSLLQGLCYNNTINKYVNGAQQINRIIFINCDNTEVSTNFFDFKCYNNTLGKATDHMRFGKECYGNVFGGMNHLCSFDTKFRNNTVGGETQSITVGQGATSNYFDRCIYYSTFGNYFRNNKVCKYTYYSTFGHYVQNITMGHEDDVAALGQYMRFLTIENGVTYINLYKTDKTTKTYMENIKIESGTCGTSSSRLNIEVSELAQKYAITYAKNSKGELIKYCEADEPTIDATEVTFEDGETFQQKYNSGQLQGAEGPQGQQGQKGEDGKTPVKGTDYYTEADKQEMVNLVLAALPSGEGVSY